MKSRVIVLIPHFNDPEGLEISINSIREDFPVDLMIVDDGSKKKVFSEKYLKGRYKRKGEIRFLFLDENSGIETALNTGLNKIIALDYPFVARLDCGDRFHQNKLKKQIDYLDTKDDIKLLGCWAHMKDIRGNLLFDLKHPRSYSEIKKKIFLNSMFIHPSVIFRTAILETIGLYPLGFPAAEDYAFFFKIVKRFKSENYPEILMDYIIDPNSISSSKRKVQVKSRIRIILKYFKLGLYPLFGLLRNFVLLMISRDMSNTIKSFLKK